MVRDGDPEEELGEGRRIRDFWFWILERPRREAKNETKKGKYEGLKKTEASKINNRIMGTSTRMGPWVGLNLQFEGGG